MRKSQESRAGSDPSELSEYSRKLKMFDHIDPLILPLGFFFFFCSFIGVIGNVIMILCTVKTRRFRSPCHLLICATCLSDALHLAGQFPFCVYLFGEFTTTQSNCFYILILPVVGLTTGGPFLLAMGIDRLIAVKFPTRYRYYQDEKMQYIIAQLVFPTVYCGSFLLFGFMEVDEKTQILCANPLALNGPAFQMYNYTGGFIYVIVFIIYLSVYIMLKTNKTSSKFKSVFRSISVTVGLVLFGWLATTIANSLSYSITDDLRVAHLIQMYAGIAVNIAAASNVFVFYAINTEYREVIKSLFGCHSKIHSSEFEASSTQMGTNLLASHKSSVVLSSQKSKSLPNLTTRRMTLI